MTITYKRSEYLGVKIKLKGVNVYPSKIYRSRYECVYYGRRGTEIKDWVRATFSNDDLVWASSDSYDLTSEYESLINAEQLELLCLNPVLEQ